MCYFCAGGAYQEAVGVTNMQQATRAVQQVAVGMPINLQPERTPFSPAVGCLNGQGQAALRSLLVPQSSSSACALDQLAQHSRKRPASSGARSRSSFPLPVFEHNEESDSNSVIEFMQESAPMGAYISTEEIELCLQQHIRPKVERS